MPPGDHEGCGLYVHVPVCVRACPYCDFDFVVDRRPDVEALVDAYRRECGERELFGRTMRTVYVGGGTPSALGPGGLASLVHALRAWFDLGAVEEVTVEANPEHVTPDLLAALVDAGVHRLSLGVQSFDPDVLALLGRRHDGNTASRAVEAAASRGLSVSVDLIAGVPDAPDGAWADDLARVVSLPVDHVSVYALSIEPDVPWTALVRRGRRRMPDPDHQAAALRRAERVLVAAGFVHYEVASYARPGKEAVHNTGYWSLRPYVGIGPSAASASYEAYGVVRRTNPRGLGAYLGGDPAEVERLGPAAGAREALWLGLRRLVAGADAEAVADRFGRSRAWIDGVLTPAFAREWVVADGSRIRLRPDMWLFHDAVGRAILGGDDD